MYFNLFLLFLLTVIFSNNIFSKSLEVNYSGKIGISFQSDIKSDLIRNEPFTNQNNMDPALIIVNEFGFTLYEKVSFGFGIDYLVPKTVFQGSKQKVQFISSFFYLKFNIIKSSESNIYLIGKVGYNLYSDLTYNSTILFSEDYSSIDLLKPKNLSFGIGLFNEQSIINLELLVQNFKTTDRYNLNLENEEKGYYFDLNLVQIAFLFGIRI